jgi:hypothetical protein
MGRLTDAAGKWAKSMRYSRTRSGAERCEAEQSVQEAFAEVLAAFLSQTEWDETDRKVADIIEELDIQIAGLSGQ